MKRPIITLLCILLLACIAQSQTELWRLNAGYPSLSTDSLGNLYVGANKSDSVAMLSRVDPTGHVFWEVRVPASYFFIQAINEGVYVSPSSGTMGGSIYFYDSTGVLQWTHPLRVMERCKSQPRLDPAGNLVVFVDSGLGTSGELYKLNSRGEQLFYVRIPPLTPGKDIWQQMWGPSVTSTGDVWMMIGVWSGEGDYRPGVKSHYKSYQTNDALLFDGTTGALLLRKNIFNGISEEERDNGKGISSSYTLNGDVYVLLTGNYDQLIAYGTFDYTITKMNGRKITEKQRSEWRFLTMDRQGNVTSLRYHGSGAYKYTDVINGYTENADVDGQANYLSDVMVGGSGAYYLHGTVFSKRTPRFGNNYVQTDDLLLKFNPVSKKIAWKMALPSPPNNGGYVMAMYQPSENIFRQRDQYVVDIINSNGKQASQPLVFRQPTNFLNPEYAHPAVEQGYSYATSTDCSALPCVGVLSKYDIGNVLAKSNVKNHPEAGDEKRVPLTFLLGQNYPNPFNPTTRIDYQLKEGGQVKLSVFNVLGQEVKILVNEMKEAGYQSVTLDGAGLPSGVYYARLFVTDGYGKQLFVATEKVLMVK